MPADWLTSPSSLVPGSPPSFLDVAEGPKQLLCAVGDSLTANGQILSATAEFRTNSAVNWLCALLKQDMWLPFGCSASYVSGAADIINYNLAVSGVTTATVLSTQIPVAVGLRTGFASYLAGTNDFTLLPADSVDTICGRIRAAVQALRQAGSIVILWTIPPRNDSAGAGNWQSFSGAITSSGSTVAAQKLKQQAVNSWIRRYAQETTGVILADVYKELADSATDDWRANCNLDGVHWNTAGAFIAGQIAANAVRSFVKPLRTSPQSLLDTYAATTNPEGNAAIAVALAGTSGSFSGTGISGNTPTGWTLDIQSGVLVPGTCAAATVARSDFLFGAFPVQGRELQATIAGSSTGNFQLRAYQTTSLAIPANTPLYAEMEVSVSGSATALGSPSLQAFFNVNSPQTFAIGMSSDGAALLAGSVYDAVIRTPIMRSTVAVQGLIFGQINGFAGAAGVIKIRSIAIRALGVTRLGTLLGAA